MEVGKDCIYTCRANLCTQVLCIVQHVCSPYIFSSVSKYRIKYLQKNVIPNPVFMPSLKLSPNRNILWHGVFKIHCEDQGKVKTVLFKLKDIFNSYKENKNLCTTESHKLKIIFLKKVNCLSMMLVLAAQRWNYNI